MIVLCSDWEGGALPASTHNSIEGWRTLGNLKDASQSIGINVFEQYLSYKILHELMHAANDRECMSPHGCFSSNLAFSMKKR